MSVRIEITGIRELQLSLRNLAQKAPKLATRPLRRAMESIMERVVDEAPRLTGETAESIVLKEGAPRDASVTIDVVLPLEHGIHRELGTRVMEADDFMQRAFDEEGEGAASRVLDEVAEGIERLL